MKKPLFLFLAIFAIAAWFFASTGMDEVKLHKAIAAAPAYAPAIPEGITKIKRRRSTTYQVNYAYEVAGTTYKLDSDTMSQEEAVALMSKPNVEVAYAKGAPTQALLRDDFDHVDRNETTSGAIVKALVMALMAAIVGALLLSWKFGWLSRKTA